MAASAIYINHKTDNYIGRKLGLVKPDRTKRGDYWCIQGWTNTLQKLDVTSDIVFFGNSITAESCFDHIFKGTRICNLGYPGDDIEGMLLRVGQIEAVHPKKVFIMAGINGLQRHSKAHFIEQYTALVDSVKRMVPQARIYLQSILPVNPNLEKGKNLTGKNRIEDFNRAVSDIAARKDCVYVDLYSVYAVNDVLPEQLTRDGVHLYPQAYERWAEAIKAYIE